ncbi:helix-turn-helix domain-containing protein [Saccharopolyspora mangrovi]|uniref:Helix-turn-helix transcriptional regulator n=1 Tax=Saccharopolyspora mangrovi TaxID=3082379 RepID=A0ABU6A8Y2_9PSEU|nr:helix-turn-helix transcriptional regulator [Saccharopolyspora sp. S2-29]MEB3367990.1 helix-turn-helix transcriptional regulator [Saccharopolyspora sp. S2-29]
MDDESFGRILRRYRATSGLTQPQLAGKVHVDQSAVSRWENDRAVPPREVIDRLDEVLHGGGHLVRAAFPAAPAHLPPNEQPVTGDYVDELRASIAHLVQLDGRNGGAELVPMAARMFQGASARLAAGKFPESLEADFTATVAELGEVAGWLAFEGGMWRAIGRPGKAVDCYAAALERIPDRYRWASFLGGASLVSALVEVRAWSEAERAATQVASLAAEVTSARASMRLREAASTARRLRAPHGLEGLLTALASS